MVLASKIDVILAWSVSGFGVKDCCDFGVVCGWFWRSRLMWFVSGFGVQAGVQD